MAVEFKFKISDESFELLLFILKNDKAEYKDHEIETLDDFHNSLYYTSGQYNDIWYLDRNANGTIILARYLKKFNLVTSKYSPVTYVLTEYGKIVVMQKQRELNINKIIQKINYI